MGLLLFASLFISDVPTIHAQIIYSVNIVNNPSFETQPALGSGPSDWQGVTFDDGNVGSTVTVNNTMSVTGMYSIRLDVSKNDTSIRYGTTATTFHITLGQFFPTTFYFNNVTNRPDGISLWFDIQPKFSGFAALSVRIRASSSAELDYVFVNPVLETPPPQLSFQNSTNGSEGGKSVEAILLPTPPLNQWNHLVRNLRRDWTAPFKLPNGMSAPGLQLNDTLNRVETDAIYYNYTGSIYAETAWIDDVALYGNSLNPAPPGPPSNYYAAFNFVDANSNPVNSVKWKLFNSTGGEVAGYAENSPSLPLEPYTLGVYYPVITGLSPEPFRIAKQRIFLNTTSLIRLEMFPQVFIPGEYVGFNNTVSNFKWILQNSTAMIFSATGNPGTQYLIVIPAPMKPVAIQRDGGNPSQTQWSYDSSLSVVTISASVLGNFSLFYQPPVTVPQISYKDLVGSSVDNLVSWKIFSSQGTQVIWQQGQLLPAGAYSIQTYFKGYLINKIPIVSSAPSVIQLPMFPLGNSGKYLAFNSTITSVRLTENTSTRISFTASGPGPSMIISQVPAKPLYIQKDGAIIPDSEWTYNSTTGIATIQSTSLGTFAIVFSDNPSIPITYLVAVIGAAGIAATGIFVWSRRRRPSISNQKRPAEDQTGTKEPFKPKNKDPRSRS